MRGWPQAQYRAPGEGAFWISLGHPPTPPPSNHVLHIRFGVSLKAVPSP